RDDGARSRVRRGTRGRLLEGPRRALRQLAGGPPLGAQDGRGRGRPHAAPVSQGRHEVDGLGRRGRALTRELHTKAGRERSLPARFSRRQFLPKSFWISAMSVSLGWGAPAAP